MKASVSSAQPFTMLLLLLLTSDLILSYATALGHISVESKNHFRLLSITTGGKNPSYVDVADKVTTSYGSSKNGDNNGDGVAEETKSTTLKENVSRYAVAVAVVEDAASAATELKSTTTPTNFAPLIGIATRKEDETADGLSEWSVRHNETSPVDMLYNVSAENGTTLLPREAEQTESWAMAILSIFSFLAVALCTASVLQRYSRRRNRRHNYQEIENLVV